MALKKSELYSSLWQPADVAGVKCFIATHPVWVSKLSRELFSDEHIASAIAECAALFPA